MTIKWCAFLNLRLFVFFFLLGFSFPFSLWSAGTFHKSWLKLDFTMELSCGVHCSFSHFIQWFFGFKCCWDSVNVSIRYSFAFYLHSVELKANVQLTIRNMWILARILQIYSLVLFSLSFLFSYRFKMIHAGSILSCWRYPSLNLFSMPQSVWMRPIKCVFLLFG